MFLLLVLILSFPVFTETFHPYGKIINKTTNTNAIVDSLKIITLEGGMNVLKEYKNISSPFSLEKLEVPDSIPILIQVNYKNVNYNKIIPPAPMFRQKEQEIIVFENTKDASVLRTRSLLQAIKEEEGFRIYKIYIIENVSNPPRSFVQTETPLEIYIPESALHLTGSLLQEGSRMAIPLQFTDGTKGKNFQRPILPGKNELQISFFMNTQGSDLQLKDKVLFESDSNSRPIFIKPTDVETQFANAISSKEIKEELPPGIRAFSVQYPKDVPLEISLKGGTPQRQTTDGTREQINGKWFYSYDRSLAGIALVLAFLFFLKYFSNTIAKRKHP